MISTNTDQLIGAKNISKALGINLTETYMALKWGGIPGAIQLPTKRGGRPSWVLPSFLAESYRSLRLYTPKYKPAEVTRRLVAELGEGKHKNIPQLIRSGKLTDTEWCLALDDRRKLCNMDVPILMHPDDFENWIEDRREFYRRQRIGYNTGTIFDDEEEVDDDMG